MQRLLLDYSYGYLVLCLVVGIGYAWLLYTARYSWSKTMNRILFGFRAILATALLVLLLGPVLRQFTHSQEKPTLVFLVDNSRSIKESTDTTQLIAAIERATESIQNSDWQVEVSALDGAESDARAAKHTKKGKAEVFVISRPHPQFSRGLNYYFIYI